MAPYLALWRVGRGSAGLLVVVVDCPTDHMPATEAGDAREAMTAFGRRWQRAAANVLAGSKDPEMDVGSRESWPELGPMLRTRAELLLEFAANDDLWQSDAAS